MKEKGIKKLIDYLNESEDGFVSKFVSYDYINRVFRLDNGQSFHYTLILSKEYCFIERLVKNDKIDLEELADKKYKIYDYEFAEDYSDRNYETLLMLLSIQDNPIKFLCSVLK